MISCTGGHSGKSTKVTQIPMTVREFLSSEFGQNNYDVIVCMGCDGGFGPKRRDLLRFPNAKLIIEYPTKYDTSVNEYDGLPCRELQRKQFEFPDPPQGLFFGTMYKDRLLRVLST